METFYQKLQKHPDFTQNVGNVTHKFTNAYYYASEHFGPETNRHFFLQTLLKIQKCTMPVTIFAWEVVAETTYDNHV